MLRYSLARPATQAYDKALVIAGHRRAELAKRRATMHGERRVIGPRDRAVRLDQDHTVAERSYDAVKLGDLRPANCMNQTFPR